MKSDNFFAELKRRIDPVGNPIQMAHAFSHC